MKVHINLAALLKQYWMTAKELSKIIWLSEQQLTSIRRQKSEKIEFATIAKLLEAFDCEPNDLFIITKDND